MELPPGPRAPAAWQTVGWMARPAAFMRRAHERFGDPVTIRTYWTEEPMVLFSGPDAVREVFRLDPAIAPAGESWEFLRPFAGEHSILLLDGEAHMRERRLLQAPFHGERMRAFAAMVAGVPARGLASRTGPASWRRGAPASPRSSACTTSRSRSSCASSSVRAGRRRRGCGPPSRTRS